MAEASRQCFAILMSTYNGQEYLREQLDSIVNQSHQDWFLFVRDDGSSDSTVEILLEYARQDPRISVKQGENLGVVGSFFELLAGVPDTFDYYAFCDQDDHWSPRKLDRAAIMLASASVDEVVIYFSRLEYVDAELNSLGLSSMPTRLCFFNALIENVATGCVMVMNSTARQLIVARLPAFALMHDWWVYLVATAFGRVLYDSEPTINYRQHGGNVLGGTASRLELIKRRLNSFFRRSRDDPRISRQVEAFLVSFQDLLDEEKCREAQRLVDSHASFGTRLQYAVSMKVRRNTILDSLLFRLLVVLDRY